MRIWLVKDGEYLPIQPEGRKMRIGMLASYLARQGHRVVWWSSTFAHFGKQLLYTRDREFQLTPNLELRLLFAGRYRRNVSLARFFHHNRLAWRLTRAYPRLERPDVIVTCYPIIEVAYQTVRFARRNGIPVLVDIRDVWPDYFLEKVPRPLRKPARLALAPLYYQARQTFRQADGLVAISPGILDWALAYAGRSMGAFDAVSYHGYDPVQATEHAPPELAPLLAQLGDRTVFVFEGNFTPPYDLRGIAEVAARLAPTHGDRVVFLLVGDERACPDLAYRAERLPNLKLTGWLAHRTLAHLLGYCHVGLLPWASEVDNAMPNKIFEYLFSGLPILSSATGDLEGMLARYRIGFSYPPGNLEALERLVRRLADDSELRQELSQNARRVFAEHFNAEVVCRRYCEQIERVAAARTSS